METKERIHKDLAFLAEQLESNLFKKQYVFDDNIVLISRVIKAIGTIKFCDILNENLSSKISLKYIRNMYYRSNKKYKDNVSYLPVNYSEKKEIIKQTIVDKKPTINDNISLEIKFKDEWKNQFNITTERCMKKLESFNLTPDDIKSWNVQGDTAIFKELAKIQTQKRK